MCPSARRADCATIEIIVAESRRRSCFACSSSMSITLLEAPLGAEMGGGRLQVGHGVAGRALVDVRIRRLEAREERLVDEQAPDLLEGLPADELLDVDAAVPERPSLAIRLGDLRAERDDALEPFLDLVHSAGIYLNAPLGSRAGRVSGRHGEDGSRGRMRPKITVVGAGNVGATATQEIARGDYADVVLVDIIEGLPQGKALDLDEAGPILDYEAKIVGTNGYEETAGSAVIVITSGRPRSPGMSRDDLVTTNQAIVKSVTEQAIAPLARRDRPRGDESARCDVPRGREEPRGFRESGSSAWPASSTPRAFARSSPGRRACPTGTCRRRARRARRPDGPGRVRHDGRRRAADEARLRRSASRRWSSARGRAAARSSTCSAPRPGTHRAPPWRRWSTSIVLDQKRVLPVHGAARGRVRDRRPLHGRSGRARVGRCRADHRARPHRLGARGARELRGRRA